MTPFAEWLKHYQKSHGIGKDNQSFESQGDMVAAWDGALQYAIETLGSRYLIFGNDLEFLLKEWMVK